MPRRPNLLRKDEIDTGVEAPPPPHALAHPVFRGDPYGVVSADNPKFPAVTQGNNRGLENRLKQLGLQYDSVAGHYDSPENSFLVYGPSREQMHQLGKDFGQESVIYGEGGRHEFHYVNGENEGRYVRDRGNAPVSFFSIPPPNYYTALPGGGYFRVNLDPDWKIIPYWPEAAKSERPKMKHTVTDLREGALALLKKYEAEFQELAQREGLRKDDQHFEPGIHEAPAVGAREHQEPGGHEQFDMDFVDRAPAQPVHSSIGLPSGELMAPAEEQPTDTDPNGELGDCPTCGQADAPGSCTCLNKADLQGYGMDAGPPAAAMGNAQAGLMLSEKPASKKVEPLCKKCQKSLCKGTCTAKAEDFVDISGKRVTKGVVGTMPDDKKPKVIDTPGSGGDPKKNDKAVKKAEESPSKSKIESTNKHPYGKCPHCKKPVEPHGTTCVHCHKKYDAKKAEPPMAKPPSGKNPATMTPVAKPVVPKVGGAPVAPGVGPKPPEPKIAKKEQHEFTARTNSPVADCKHCGKERKHANHAQEPVEETWETKARRGAGGSDYPSQRSKVSVKKAELGACLFCGFPEHSGACR